MSRHPRRTRPPGRPAFALTGIDAVGVSGANGVASSGGLGHGVLVSAALVQLLPAPRVLPFVALLVLFAIAIAGVWLMPEPIAVRSRARLTLQRPHVPAAIRGPFMLAALGAISSWSIAGLFLSLGPEFSAQLLHSTNHLVTGVGVFVSPGRLRRRSSPSAAPRRGPERRAVRSPCPPAWSSSSSLRRPTRPSSTSPEP